MRGKNSGTVMAVEHALEKPRVMLSLQVLCIMLDLDLWSFPYIESFYTFGFQALAVHTFHANVVMPV